MSKDLVSQKEVSKAIDRTNECMRLLMNSGLSEKDKQRVIDDSEFRSELVEFWKSLTFPTITITGNEDLCFPDWPHKMKKNVIKPVGTLKLEFFPLLSLGEMSISGDYILLRTQQRLGLCHAQAFLAKYETKSFGLPKGAKLPFPGTLIVEWNSNRAHIPFLRWVDNKWILVWEYIGIQCGPDTYILLSVKK